MIKFLANENVPAASVRKLQDEGFDVVSVSADFPSICDESVLAFAARENRIIITFDRDYGEMIFKSGWPAPPAGVIYFRIRDFRPEKPAEILLDLIGTQNLRFESFFTVIGENNVRQRKL